MTKKVFKYFFNAVDGQERWLNEMAAKGFQLVKTTRAMYEFQSCNPLEYEYRVEFVADKSYKQLMKYRDFLKEMGFQSFTKNINMNYSIGKVRLRPWAKGAGMIATSPGSINKELLILEKKRDGKPFEIHTDLDDLIGYYRNIRNAYLFADIMIIALIAFGSSSDVSLELLNILGKSIITVLGIFFAFLSIKYSMLIHHYKEKRKINE